MNRTIELLLLGILGISTFGFYYVISTLVKILEELKKNL